MSHEVIDTLKVEASALTDRGCIRPLNEDSALLVRPSEAGLLDAKGILALVADGMGGHRGGEVASAEATEVIRRAYYGSRAEPTEALAEALEEANRAIYRRAERDGKLEGMGTTCTALVIRRNLAHLAHVGDSRMYLLRGDDLLQMTGDHSQVAELVRQGVLTGEQARNRNDRNVITRALGTTPRVAVETWPRPFALRAGDRILLSTDGLHDALERQTIQGLIASGDVHSAAGRLVAAAKEAGGKDNISVVLLTLSDPSRGPERAPVTTRRVRIPS